MLHTIYLINAFWTARYFFKRIFGEGFQPLPYELPPFPFEIPGTLLPFGLSTHDVIEGIAVHQQFAWSGVLGSHTPEAYDIVHSITYRKLLACWEVLHGEACGGLASHGEFEFMLSAMPTEFYAILDLALMPPFEPGQLSAGRPWSFYDLDPGARFSALLHWLTKRKFVPTSIQSSHARLTYTQITTEACQHFGWPQPSALALDWLKCLKSNVDEPVPGFVNTSSDTTFRIAVELMQLRVNDPLRAAIGALTQDESVRAGFQMYVSPDQGGWEARPTLSGRDGNQIWSRFYLTQVAHFLALGEVGVLTSLKAPRRIEAVRYAVGELIGHCYTPVEDEILNRLTSRLAENVEV